MPAECQNGEIDGTPLHGLLRPFIGVKELHLCADLSKELHVDDVGSNPERLLVPGLHESDY